ncbi:HD domain-containing protein [Thermococcus gorgonarius]|uniref:5'-deoxynucleotidase n=1 Tax=Thermococcus gorgonarius TaxID=71997 RepID=A0A2Z2M8X9_THEGO|nr:HD family hydrolase [Thermococcus gorgonarius]ASJ00882.1 oxetanocin [Thermococcus gorgonarius]
MELLEFFLEAGNLKRLRRTGWLLRGIPNPESIADHSFRTALITLFLGEELRRKGIALDLERALKIALIHDLGEARITDIPFPAQRYFNKVEGERKALVEMVGSEYLALFDEYEQESTLEGKLVKFADRLEMLLQALEYEKSGFSGLEEFWKTIEKLKKNELYEYFGGLVEKLISLRP